MQDQSGTPSHAVSRRQFLKSSTVAAAAAAVSFPAVVSADTKQPINAIIIGVGGRGGGAGRNFLDAAKEVGCDAKIVAVADVFPEAANKGTEHFGVPAEKCFSGFDGYRKALAEPGVNYCILATPPGFRASHFRACVEAGKNVFTEKPVCVDGPGARMMYESAEMAKQKGLKVAAGTQRRHQAAYIDTIKRIQDGSIGDIVTLRAYWVNGGPIWHRGDKGDTELERQVHNWYHYIWLCGDHICEQHVHNLDVCNWIMNDHPVKCWGMGARQQLGDKSGEIWDNFAVEYEYANGVRLFSYCGQIKREWSSVSEDAEGSKGTAALSGGAGGMIRPKGGELIRIKNNNVDPYVQEHIDLITAIQKDLPLNEAKQVTDSTVTAIMGREAAYTGAAMDWETIVNSKFAYGPDQLYKDSSKMAWGESRVLMPPMPSLHDIRKNPALIQVAKA